MSKFIVNGNRALRGTVDISGSKNGALPIIFSTIITRGVSVLSSVPDISDVQVATEIITELGARVERRNTDLIIDTSSLEYVKPNERLTARIRASSYLLGACLARFGVCHIQSFGGCNFDNRPIDMHVEAMTLLGAERDGEKFFAKKLIGTDIVFKKISVGATVNAILLTAAAEGKSRIFGYAKEPHVISLVEFLRAAGANISLYPDYIEVIGSDLHGANARIIPDMIEAGTYIALSVLTDSELKVKGIETEHLSSFFDLFVHGGVNLSLGDDFVIASGGFDDFLNVVAEPYPAFPSDLQPQMAPLLANFFGGTITEKVWMGRFGYLTELSKFGLKSDVCQSYARIYPSKIRSANAVCPDLRGGAALLMCALSANGESILEGAEIIKRGYCDIIGKLRAIGAGIEEIV